MDLGRLITAMVTPMNEDYSVNYDKAQELAAWLLDNGSDSLVVTGTTGESPTLRQKEKLKLYAAVGEVCRGAGKPMLAGTGSYDTVSTVELSKKAEALGADAILAVTPQYNKPPQDGLFRHFKILSEAVNIPVIPYNVPSRTSVNLEPETVARIAALENVIGLKEASGDLDQMSRILQQTPADFQIYCGDDYLALPALAIGACGVVSVASHIIGREMQEMAAAFEIGDQAAATELHHRNYPAYKTLFIRTNPIPVKYALNRMGLNVGPCRPPLVELDEEAKGKVDRLLRDLGRI